MEGDWALEAVRVTCPNVNLYSLSLNSDSNGNKRARKMVDFNQ